MRRERGDDVVEGTGPKQVDLPAAMLLGRRADELDANGQVPGRGGHQERAGVGHRDQVVPAAVADPGKRVVFGQQRDRLPRRTGVGAERRRQSPVCALDGVTVRLDECADPLGRAVLRVRELGIGVDRSGQPDELVP